MDLLPPRSLGHVVLLWLVFSLAFLLLGGIGAGLTTLVYEAVTGNELEETTYAIFFAGYGFIAYQMLVRYYTARS